ncbi:LysR substrate-binding domain-containing protein [uncultured Psychrobacter sp.]|uniref:LysR substrate-binding domain-containing protein n=1 Tax=uncultured Psychrobacter sp. TaxID=259303 RepID=UPI00261B99D5|nr:LysR substrate-binding domain-containing protein [uncultured Psychrobacter sp.]
MKNEMKTPLAFRRYPSTTALQCFETAARHLSFTNAAQEMHMTQSAISKQVAQLEEMLNLSLFYRTPHRISLTPAGKTYYLEVLDILKHIEAATTSLMSNSDNSEILKIVSHPTFCSRWLMPALSEFNQAHPLINLNIKELAGPFFSEDQNVDVAFLYGDGIWAGMESIKLFDEYSVAVCHPEYLIDKSPCTHNLDNCILLQLSSRPSAWYEYFRQQDISIDGTFVGPRFDTFHTTISAALLGYGIALVPLRLVAPELRSGALVTAWSYAANGRGAYYMSYPLSLGNSHKVKVILEWVTAYLEKSNEYKEDLDFIL